MVSKGLNEQHKISSEGELHGNQRHSGTEYRAVGVSTNRPSFLLLRNGPRGTNAAGSPIASWLRLMLNCKGVEAEIVRRK